MILQCWRDDKNKEIMAFLKVEVMEVMTHYTCSCITLQLNLLNGINDGIGSGCAIMMAFMP